MSIKISEVGKILNVNAAFDLSGNSDLELIFTSPGGTQFTKTKADGVSAPSVPFTDDCTDETFNADEYWSYTTDGTEFTESGTYTVVGRYIDLTPKNFCGDPAMFTVLPCGLT